MPRKSNEQIVKEIGNVRSRNNWLWMALLALALEGKPKKAKKILGEINKNDKEISKWLGKLQH